MANKKGVGLTKTEIVKILGTVFFIKSDGTVLTNLHVLKDSKYGFIRDVKGNIFQIEKITRVCRECDIADMIAQGSVKISRSAYLLLR